MDPALRDYIVKARANGTVDADIRGALLRVGWDSKLVDEALQTVGVPKIGAAGALVDPTQMSAASKSLESITTSQRAVSSEKSTNPVSQTTKAITASGAMPPKRSWRWLIRIVIVLVVLLVIGVGSAWFYFDYYAPRKLLITSASNFENAQTAKYQINVVPVFGAKGNALAANYNASSTDTIIQLSGGYDLRSNPDKVGTSVSIVSTDDFGNPTNLLTAQIVSIGTQIYGMVTANSQFAQQLNITSLLSQWYVGQSALETARVDNTIADNQSNATVINQALKNNFPMTIQKDLGTHMVGSVSTHEYQLGVNTNKLSSFLADTSLSAVTKVGVNTFFNSLTSVEVWINPTSGEIDQLRLGNNLAPYGSSVTNYVKSVTTTITLSDLGSPITINTPTSTEPFPGFSLLKGF